MSRLVSGPATAPPVGSRRPSVMMPDEHALLMAVAAAPADDLPRLVYADWLEEHGQHARAEFVRLQCRIATLEAGPRAVVNQHIPLWRRQQDLLDHHLPELIGPGLEEVTGFSPRFDRGFVAAVEVPAADFAQHAAAVCGLVPLPRIAVTGAALARQILDCEPSHLDRVTELFMQPAGRGTPARLTSSRIIALRHAAQWERLAVLNAEGCQMNGYGATYLTRGDAFPALTDLDLSQNDLADWGVVALLNSGLLRRLTRLVLGGNPITDLGAFELADRLGPDNRLEHLNLRFTNISSAGQSALLSRFGSKLTIF